MTESETKKYDVQVNDGHYTNRSYLSVGRWSTYSLVIEQVLSLSPKKILEIGPGPGIVTGTLRRLGFEVKTLDIDPALESDYCMSLMDSNLKDIGRYDLVIASEVFEHVEYQDFLRSTQNLASVTDQLLLTLPDTNIKGLFFGIRIRFPLWNKIIFGLKIRFGRALHRFDGQHYWEIGKKGYSLNRLRSDLRTAGWSITKTQLNIDNPYHRLILARKQIHDAE